MLGRTKAIPSVLSLLPLLVSTACYSGIPDQGPGLGVETPRVALLNPLDKAIGLDDEDVRPRLIAGQYALAVAATPIEQRPTSVDSLAVVPVEDVAHWKQLEVEVDSALDDFWLDVSESPEFDNFRQAWSECVGGEFASDVELTKRVESLRAQGDEDEAEALRQRSDTCTAELATTFNAAVAPVYEAWAKQNEELLTDYKHMVMSASNDLQVAK